MVTRPVTIRRQKQEARATVSWQLDGVIWVNTVEKGRGNTTAADHREVIFPLPPEEEEEVAAMAKKILNISPQDLAGDGVAAALPTRSTGLNYEGIDSL